jgi:uncharacterized protein
LARAGARNGALKLTSGFAVKFLLTSPDFSVRSREAIRHLQQIIFSMKLRLAHSARWLALVVAFAAAPFALRAAAAADSAPTSTPAPTAEKPARPKHFLIILRLVPRLHDPKAWTETDNAAVSAHFNRLKAATETGQVLLAGRTNEPGDKTIGLVIFSAPDEAAARAFMNDDPCVSGNVMTATLHPYALALRAKNP